MAPPATVLSWPNAPTSSTSVTHSYAAQDIYTVSVDISDGCGNLATDEIVVVASDPNDGFTTRGARFIPDAESFLDSTLVTSTTAKANFGFVVKYKQGASNPSGNLEFVYRSGDIDLHSLDMEWLLITSATKVRFKGLATINGEGEYTFKVTAEDNGNPGGKRYVQDRNLAGRCGYGKRIADAEAHTPRCTRRW